MISTQQSEGAITEKRFFGFLIGLMAAGLLYVILVPSIRTSEASWPIAIALTVGMAGNLLYLWLRQRQLRGFLARHGLLRALIVFWLLCTPQLLVVALELFNFEAHRHPVFSEAVSLMEESDVAKRDLGPPIKVGWSTAGRFGENKDRGELILEVPVSGSHGEGKMRVAATKTHGVWKIDKPTLKLHDSNVPESLIADGKTLPHDRP
jgi:Cytochrome oxidase complex assembly protein 1